jgi:ELWxxDGT repeat protein
MSWLNRRLAEPLEAQHHSGRESRRRRLDVERLEDRLTPSASLVRDINPLPGGSPADLTAVGGTLFFTVTDARHGRELWKSNGTAAGTALVKDINPGPANSYASYLTNVNGTLFFRATDPTDGTQLWKTNGTAAGTVIVTDMLPGGGGAVPTHLINVNGTLFFVGNDGAGGRGLWKTDGTPSGTVLVDDANPGGSGSDPNELTNVKGTLYFTIRNGTTGFTLWKSDGTTSGTVAVQSFVPGFYYPGGPHYLTTSTARCSSSPTTAPMAGSYGRVMGPQPGRSSSKISTRGAIPPTHTI